MYRFLASAKTAKGDVIFIGRSAYPPNDRCCFMPHYMRNIKVGPYIIPQKSFDLSAAISYSDNLKILTCSGDTPIMASGVEGTCTNPSRHVLPPTIATGRLISNPYPAPHNPEIDVK